MTLLCDRYGYSSHIEKIFFILQSFETASWTDSRRDIWEHIQAYGVKGDIIRQKLREAFWERALWCVHSTEGVIPLHHKAVFEQGSSESEKVIFCDVLKTIVKSEIS